jgi:phosphohistidine phosphatase
LPDELLSELRDLDEATATVLLIGHQPTLGDLVLGLAKPSDLTREVQERFPTCALSVLTYRGGWKTLDRGRATLKAYEIPRG